MSDDDVVIEVDPPPREVIPAEKGFFELELWVNEKQEYDYRRSPVVAWVIDPTTFELFAITVDGPVDPLGEWTVRAIKTPDGMVIDTAGDRFDNESDWMENAKDVLGRLNPASSNIVRPKFRSDDED